MHNMRTLLRVVFETILVENFDASLVDPAAEAFFPLICLSPVRALPRCSPWSCSLPPRLPHVYVLCLSLSVLRCCSPSSCCTVVVDPRVLRFAPLRVLPSTCLLPCICRFRKLRHTTKPLRNRCANRMNTGHWWSISLPVSRTTRCGCRGSSTRSTGSCLPMTSPPQCPTRTRPVSRGTSETSS